MRNFVVASENLASASHYGLLSHSHPTYQHLRRSFDLLMEYFPTAYDDLVAAIWLHDALKYTTTTFNEIRLVTNARVARICELSTDPGPRILTGNEVRQPRSAVKQKLYENFQAEKDPSIKRDVSILRLVDRLENHTTATRELNHDKMAIYRAEVDKYTSVFQVSNVHPYSQEAYDRLLSDVEKTGKAITL